MNADSLEQLRDRRGRGTQMQPSPTCVHALMPSVRARRINRSATLKAKHFTRRLPEPVPCSGPLSRHCSRKASFQPVHPVQALSAGHGLYRLYRLYRMSQRRWYGCNGSPSGTHRDIGREREPGLVEIERPGNLRCRARSSGSEARSCPPAPRRACGSRSSRATAPARRRSPGPAPVRALYGGPSRWLAS